MDRGTAEANVVEMASLARLALTGATDEQLAQGERAIRRRLSNAKRPRTPMAARVAALGVLVSIVLAVGLYWQRSTERSLLSYRIENGSLGADQTIVASGAQSARLRFSDGTEIKLQPNTTARVRHLSDRGAALALDSGQLRAEVVPSGHSEWRFDVGPYVIQVTGTVFDVSWEPDPDRFELKLEHGSVTVHAPVSNGPIPVRAGQWLTIRSRSNEITIRDLTTLNPSAPLARPEASSKPVPDLAPATSASGPIVAPPALSSHELAGSESWSKALRLGHLDRIILDAERRGLESSVNTVSSEDLSALADAARFSRRNDIARLALGAQRRRFSGSRRAVEAAFLLGKVAEAERDNMGALKHFNQYLEEAPAGRYAGEALGRKMAIIQQTAGSAAAKATAMEYISKYPDGSYAAVARAILNGP
jgi:hypothetical protein